jgi:hypothetical protein
MKRLVLLLFVAVVACKAERVGRIPDTAVTTSQSASRADSESLKAVGYVAPSSAPATSGVPGGVTAGSPRLVGGAGPQGPPQWMPRLIVRTAEVRLIVSDAGSVARALTAAAEGMGGYVGDARTWREGEQLRGTLTLRVPATRLGEVLAAVRKSAIRVESETISSDDVSQEYVDLAAQLRNQEAAENELRELMTDVRQKTKRAADVIEMYQQLASIRGEVERTKGRMQFLEQTSAMSTVKIDLIPDALAKPVVERVWQPLVVVKDAGRALVGTAEWLATVAIWLLIYVAPVLLLLLLPIVLGVRLYRRRGITIA